MMPMTGPASYPPAHAMPQSILPLRSSCGGSDAGAGCFRLEVLPQELHRGEGGLSDDVLGGGNPFVAPG